MKTFPDNTLSSFRVKLPSTINLTAGGGRWEVGLGEILYPKTWHNVNDKDDVTMTVLTVVNGVMKHHYISVAPGLYESVFELIDAFNTTLCLSGLTEARLDFLTEKRKVRITLGRSINEIWLGQGLQIRLGFGRRILQGPSAINSSIEKPVLVVDELRGRLYSPEVFSLPGESFDNKDDGEDGLRVVMYLSSRCQELNGNFSALYVYCDIVESRPVGDVSVPLLRTLSTSKGKIGETVGVSMQPIHYLPVNRTAFDTVEINIRSDAGDLVPFQSGKVIVTLHFRRVE